MAQERNELTSQEKSILPTYRENLMGLPVVLHDGAYTARHGEQHGIVVPDVKGLEAAMAVGRISLPPKLGGKEIKFLRRAMGLKAVELAKFLDLSAEHFSRHENGVIALSTNTERVLRLRVLHSLRDRVPCNRTNDDDILGMSFKAVRDSVSPLTMVFRRVVGVVKDKPAEIWFFDGVATNESSAARKVA